MPGGRDQFQVVQGSCFPISECNDEGVLFSRFNIRLPGENADPGVQRNLHDVDRFFLHHREMIFHTRLTSHPRRAGRTFIDIQDKGF